MQYLIIGLSRRILYGLLTLCSNGPDFLCFSKINLQPLVITFFTTPCSNSFGVWIVFKVKSSVVCRCPPVSYRSICDGNDVIVKKKKNFDSRIVRENSTAPNRSRKDLSWVWLLFGLLYEYLPVTVEKFILDDFLLTFLFLGYQSDTF